MAYDRYEMEIVKSGLGYRGGYTVYDSADPGGWPVGIDPSGGWWRPTRNWLERVLRKKMNKARIRREAFYGY